MPKRIMVIGDDEAMRERISALLASQSYVVSSQTHADYTQAQAFRARPYLFILDQMDGDDIVVWQTAQKLRLDRQLASLPVVICISVIIAAEMIAGFQSKQISFVNKPFRDAELLTVVSAALEAASLRRHVRQHSNGKYEN